MLHSSRSSLIVYRHQVPIGQNRGVVHSARPATRGCATRGCPTGGMGMGMRWARCYSERGHFPQMSRCERSQEWKKDGSRHLGGAIPHWEPNSNSHYLNRASSHWPLASPSLVCLVIINQSTQAIPSSCTDLDCTTHRGCLPDMSLRSIFLDPCLQHTASRRHDGHIPWRRGTACRCVVHQRWNPGRTSLDSTRLDTTQTRNHDIKQ